MSAASIRLEDGSEEHCIIITKPETAISRSMIEGDTMVKKLVKNQTGWAKVIVNNLFILYVNVGEEDKPEYVEVPHSLCDSTFSKTSTDMIIAKNNFFLQKINGVEKKIPIVPSYIFAERRTQRKCTAQVANWWLRHRDHFQREYNKKSSYLFSIYKTRYNHSYPNIPKAMQWFYTTLALFEADVKAKKDPLARYNEMVQPVDVLKKSEYVAPVAPRIADVAREQAKARKLEREKAKQAEEESSDESSSDDSDDEEEQKKAVSEESESESESESEEEVKPAPKAAPKPAAPVRRNFESDSDSDSDSDSEEEQPKSKAKAVAPAKAQAKAKEVKKEVKKEIVSKAGGKRRNFEDSDSDSDSDSESEEEVKAKPVAKKAKK